MAAGAGGKAETRTRDRPQWSRASSWTVRVLLGFGGKPGLLELFADDIMLSAVWDRILESAAREAAGTNSVATTAHRAREFIGMVDKMEPSTIGTSGSGRVVHAVNGPLLLRGIMDGVRLLHASVINGPVVAA